MSVSGEFDPFMFDATSVEAIVVSDCGDMYHLFNNGCFVSCEVPLVHTGDVGSMPLVDEATSIDGVIEVSLVIPTVTSNFGDEATTFMLVPGSHESTAAVNYVKVAPPDMEFM